MLELELFFFFFFIPTVFASCLLFYLNRNSLDFALSRPITVLDNERFTVQSVIPKLVCPVVLVSSKYKIYDISLPHLTEVIFLMFYCSFN